jgi:hypothetical protein
MSTNDNPTHHLFDADTGDDLGPATPEQVAASNRSERREATGIIVIDGDGDVVEPGSFFDRPECRNRRVYTQAVTVSGPQLDAIVTAAWALLIKLEHMTTDAFANGGEKAEREALRKALGGTATP